MAFLGWFSPRKPLAVRERFAKEEARLAEAQAERDRVLEAGLAERSAWLQWWKQEGREPMPASAGAPLRRPRRAGPGRWAQIQLTHAEGRPARPPGGWAEIQRDNLS